MSEWLDISLWVWLGCAASLFVGAFVQRATGFGLAVIGAPLLLMLESRLVPVVLVMFGLMVALMMVGAYRREVVWAPSVWRWSDACRAPCLVSGCCWWPHYSFWRR